MNEFADILETQLRTAAERRHRPRRRIGFEAIVATAAVAVGVALLLVLGHGERSNVVQRPAAPRVAAAVHDLDGVEVAVLSSSRLSRLAQSTADRLARAGATITRTTNGADQNLQRTRVAYARGHRRDADAVLRVLIGPPASATTTAPRVVPLDAATRAVAGRQADVVVLAGLDADTALAGRESRTALDGTGWAGHVAKQIFAAGLGPGIMTEDAPYTHTRILYRPGSGRTALAISRLIGGVADQDSAMRVRTLDAGTTGGRRFGPSINVVVQVGEDDHLGGEQTVADNSTVTFADGCPQNARVLNARDTDLATLAVLHAWPAADGAVLGTGHTSDVLRGLRQAATACNLDMRKRTAFVPLYLTRYEPDRRRAAVLAFVSCVGDRWVVWKTIGG